MRKHGVSLLAMMGSLYSGWMGSSETKTSEPSSFPAAWGVKATWMSSEARALAGKAMGSDLSLGSA